MRQYLSLSGVLINFTAALKTSEHSEMTKWGFHQMGTEGGCPSEKDLNGCGEPVV